MALTPQQIAERRKKYGLDNITTNTSNVGVSKSADDRIKELRSGVPEAPQNVLTTLAKGIIRPFARAGVNAYNTVAGAGTLGAAAIAKLRGKDEQASELVGEAGRQATKVRNLPFLGETAPVGSREGDSTFAGIKDILGTGLEIGSNFVGAGAASQTAKAGFRTALKEGVKTGLRTGAATGAAAGAGNALEENKGAIDTLQDIILGTAIGGAVGAGTGAVSAAASKVLDATKKLRSKLPGVVDEAVTTPGGSTAAPVAEEAPGIMTGVKENLRAKANRMKGARERSVINTQEKIKARQEFEKLEPVEQSAIRKGLLPRDTQLIKTATPKQKELNKKILQAAEDYENLRGNAGTRPSSVIGKEFRDRVYALDESLRTANKDLDATVQELSGQNVNMATENTVNKVISRMAEKDGLQGIRLEPDGTLDFSRTTLSSDASATARKNVQQVFDDMVKRATDPEKLHLLRKELFEDLGGKKKGSVQLNKTEEEAVNGIRQGMADAISEVSPAYKDKNVAVAKLLDLEKRVTKFFGEPKGGLTDIFDAKSGSLLRRVTSEAPTGQDIASILSEAETMVKQYGHKFDTNLVQAQEFLNLLNRYYDIAPDTSLLGIMKTALPTSKAEIFQRIVKLVGENTLPSDATAKQAIRELLENAATKAPAAKVTPATAAPKPKVKLRTAPKKY